MELTRPFIAKLRPQRRCVAGCAGYRRPNQLQRVFPFSAGYRCVRPRVPPEIVSRSMRPLGLDSLASQLDIILELVCEELQLTTSQYDSATRSYEAVGDWLDRLGSLLARFNPRIFPQGSMSLGTTNKPRDTEEFDVDLVCLLDSTPHQETPDSTYLAVLDQLRSNGTYASRVKPKHRCIRLEYANQFHLDVIPACPFPRPELPWGQLALVIPDRNRRIWVPSNPRGYASWFQSRTGVIDGRVAASVQPLPPHGQLPEKSILHRVVQLLKRRRDVRFNGGPFAPSSILLTTIAGRQYGGEESLCAAIQSILDYLAGWHRLDTNGQPPRVANPTDPSEDLAGHWRDNSRHFHAFTDFVITFQEDMQRLLAARGVEQVAAILDGMFDSTGSGVVKRAITAYTSLSPFGQPDLGATPTRSRPASSVPA